MRLLDMYWASKDEWCHFEGTRLVVNDDAPEDAKESYKRYLEELKTKRESI